MSGMTLVAFATVKGSPGGTTAAFAVAAALRGHAGIVIADCDPSGGDVGARLGCSPEPGIVDLAAATRGGQDGQADALTLFAFTQGLASGVRILAAPAGGRQAAAALGAMVGLPAHPILLGARRPGLVVLADVGRLAVGSAARPIAAGADLLAIVVRPSLDGAAHLVDTVPRLLEMRTRLGLVVIGRGEYQASEVAEEAEIPLMGELPFDRAGARLLPAAISGRWAAGRTRLVRAAYPLAWRLLETAGGTTDLTGQTPARPRGFPRRRTRTRVMSKDRSS